MSGACSRHAWHKLSYRTYPGFRPVRRACVPGTVGAVRDVRTSPRGGGGPAGGPRPPSSPGQRLIDWISSTSTACSFPNVPSGSACAAATPVPVQLISQVTVASMAYDPPPEDRR